MTELLFERQNRNTAPPHGDAASDTCQPIRMFSRNNDESRKLVSRAAEDPVTRAGRGNPSRRRIVAPSRLPANADPNVARGYHAPLYVARGYHAPLWAIDRSWPNLVTRPSILGSPPAAAKLSEGSGSRDACANDESLGSLGSLAPPGASAQAQPEQDARPG
jgi:hypothetical protein